jgi:hypothetical protein
MDSPGVIGTSLSISRFSFQPIKSEAMHEAFVTNLNEPDFKLDVVSYLLHLVNVKSLCIIPNVRSWLAKDFLWRSKFLNILYWLFVFRPQ